MKEFPFQIKVAGATETAMLRFANQSELLRYHRSLAPFAAQSFTAVREAVEFTRLAAKRWRYYSRADEAVESFDELRQKIKHAPKSEIAFIMVATVRQGRRDLPVGLAYCRRTWCHHLALDFLALHPRTLEQPRRASGVGSGMVFGLVCLAKILDIPRIWGEATVNSAAFYENLLAVRPVQDLFVIENPEMLAIIRRQEKISNQALVSQATSELV